MRFKRYFVSSLVCGMILLAGYLLASGAIPHLINYQGKLTDHSGDPVADGPYNLCFKIYGSESGTDSLWWECHSNVQVTNGIFSVILGAVTALDLSFDSQYWLEVKVGGETITPRRQLTSIGYSFRAQKADTAESIMDDAVTSSKIQDGAIQFVDIGQNGASENQVMKWSGGAWVAAEDEGGSGNWVVVDSVLYTNNYWGIARGNASDALLGDSIHTMVNLGVACTTGTTGQNYYYQTVSGGKLNVASREYCTVGGGLDNTASDWWCTVGGGTGNLAGPEERATVGGGSYNQATGTKSTISGGSSNVASGTGSTVGGGEGNLATDVCSTVGGGDSNEAFGGRATVSGGYDGHAWGDYSTVGGGDNNVANGSHTTVAGGDANFADETGTTVSGGASNYAYKQYSCITGGINHNTNGRWSAICGGANNTTTADYAFIGGGHDQTAKGFASATVGGENNEALGDYSFAAGRRAIADHNGAFVWADASGAELKSTQPNQFLIRASGGTKVYSDADQTAGVTIHAGASAWAVNSDRNLKENFTPVDGQELLSKIAALPIAEWNYKTQSEKIKHIGPVAQDFRAIFGLGDDDVTISTIDPAGVALAAIKELINENRELKKIIEQLKLDLEELKSR